MNYDKSRFFQKKWKPLSHYIYCREHKVKVRKVKDLLICDKCNDFAVKYPNYPKPNSYFNVFKEVYGDSLKNVVPEFQLLSTRIFK